jgi:hypothetical protein
VSLSVPQLLEKIPVLKNLFKFLEISSCIRINGSLEMVALKLIPTSYSEKRNEIAAPWQVFRWRRGAMNSVSSPGQSRKVGPVITAGKQMLLSFK